MKWIKSFWGWLGGISLIYGLVPATFVAILVTAFAYLGKLAVSQLITLGLVSYAAVLVILRFSSSRIVAYIVIVRLFTIVLSFSGYRVKQIEDSYQMSFSGIDALLMPTTFDRDMAGGGQLYIVVTNPYNFTLYVQAKQMTTSLNGMTNGPTQLGLKADMLPFTTRGLPDEFITFPSPLNPRQLAKGTFDFNLCYGREADNLEKSLHVDGAVYFRFQKDEEIETVYDISNIRYGECGS